MALVLMARLVLLTACLTAVLGHGVDELSPTTATATTTPPTIKYYNDLVTSLPSLSGRCVAITGTTSGLGYWIAVAVARKAPACIVMLNRMSSRAVQAQQEIQQLAGAGVEVTTVTCDLQNLTSVREAAAGVGRAAARHGGLDALALNAGIMLQPDVRTVDGFDLQMGTNHLGHFLLTNLLMPSLEAAVASRGESRVVTASSLARSSLGAVDGGGPVAAKYYLKSPAGSLGGNASSAEAERYHQSKVANFVFPMALHAKLKAAGKADKLKAMSSAPGIADTDLNLPSILHYAWVRHLLGMSAPDGSCSMLTALFAPAVRSGDFYEPSHLLSGPPVKVVAEGEPLSPAFPRSLLGIHDKDLCSEETLATIWKASEDGLGIKWDVNGTQEVLI